jgi:hypothetical protein
MTEWINKVNYIYAKESDLAMKRTHREEEALCERVEHCCCIYLAFQRRKKLTYGGKNWRRDSSGGGVELELTGKGAQENLLELK